MSNIVNHTGLKTALLLDAVSCTAIAVLHLASTTSLALWLGIATGLLQGSAIFLLIYAGFLLVLARTSGIRVWLLRLIVRGNVGWALACLVLAFEGRDITGPGMAYLAIQAIAVSGIAAWQRHLVQQALIQTRESAIGSTPVHSR